MNKELAAIIGCNIHKYREAAGMTQAQLAEAVGVGNAFISRVERGNKLMKLEKLYMTAEVLGVSCDALPYAECEDIQIKNISRMLSGQSPVMILGVEQIVRVCVKYFKEKI